MTTTAETKAVDPTTSSSLTITICRRSSRCLVNLALALLVVSLNACGFATAPVVYGSAWVAGTTVKAAEAGRKHSIRAASYIRDQALSGSNSPNQRTPGPPRH